MLALASLALSASDVDISEDVLLLFLVILDLADRLTFGQPLRTLHLLLTEGDLGPLLFLLRAN